MRKREKFMENHKRNKETKHLYAAKTDCLLVCSDSDPFFGSSSVDEYFGSHSGNGFESRGNVVCPAENTVSAMTEQTDIMMARSISLSEEITKS